MASVSNDWIGYLDRSYSQIKSSLLSRVTNSNPEMTDHSESNIFIIIVSMFAAIAEMLGYYIDNIAREAFMVTAQRYSSVIKHAKMLDYRASARSPETADVTLTWTDGTGTPRVTLSAFTLGIGSYVEDETGIRYVTTEDHSIGAGVASSQISFKQIVQSTDSNIGTTDGTANQKFSLGTDYVDGSISVTINTQPYTNVTTFAHSAPTDYHFIVELDPDGNMYAIFGDDINGAIPPTGQSVLATYQTTNGPDDKVGANKLTYNVSLLGLPADHDATSDNLQGSSGGDYYEDMNSIAKNAVNSIRTLDRMVTYQDFIDVIESVAGVEKAKPNFCCGKNISIYIAPTGGGIAQTALIADAQTQADESKMLTTFPTVYSAGESRVVIGAIVVAKKRVSLSETKTQVETALVEFGDISNMEINGAIRISDIGAVIDNQSNVDYVDLNHMYTIPYARPSGHTTILDWDTETLVGSTSKITWRLQYNQSGDYMIVIKDGVYQANVPVGDEYVDSSNTFKFTVNASSYSDGEEWNFTVQPYTDNLFFTDFTIPVIQLVDLTITVVEASIEEGNIC